MTARVRAFGPWVVTAAVIATGLCALAWPTVTGWAAGGTVGVVALVAGTRRFLEEQRPELTADEARELADELGRELYLAQDALAFVAECCDIADREHHTITTTDVRAWLKGAQCARQTGLVLDPGGCTPACAGTPGIRGLLEHIGIPHTEHCPTPETHNWGCGCPGDQMEHQ